MNDKMIKGRLILREIMGDDYMERREARSSTFSAPLNEFIDEQCFGELWARPGLDRKTRSLILISTLAALNRPEQMKAHVESAINNGASVEEIQETLYQVVLYCGLPAASDGFRLAEEVLKRLGKL